MLFCTIIYEYNKNIKKYLRDKIIPYSYSFYLKILNKLLSI